MVQERVRAVLERMRAEQVQQQAVHARAGIAQQLGSYLYASMYVYIHASVTALMYAALAYTIAY